MTTHAPFQPRSGGAAPASPAIGRLVKNRALLTEWLAQDAAVDTQPSLGLWAAGALLPLIVGVRQQTPASLGLGALIQTWLRRTPAGMGPLALVSPVLGGAMGVVRRYPKFSLAVITLGGVAWWWSRSRPHPSLLK